MEARGEPPLTKTRKGPLREGKSERVSEGTQSEGGKVGFLKRGEKKKKIARERLKPNLVVPTKGGKSSTEGTHLYRDYVGVEGGQQDGLRT